MQDFVMEFTDIYLFIVKLYCASAHIKIIHFFFFFQVSTLEILGLNCEFF